MLSLVACAACVAFVACAAYRGAQGCTKSDVKNYQRGSSHNFGVEEKEGKGSPSLFHHSRTSSQHHGRSTAR